MRWLVVFLVVLNLSVFAYFTFLNQEQRSVVSRQQRNIDWSQVKQLQFKSELSESELAKRDKRKVLQPPKKTVPAISPGDLCFLIGAYEEIISARTDSLSLKKLGVENEMVNLAQLLPTLYWVYIRPQSSEKAAVKELNKLQSSQIDSYLVTEGDYKNAISLGVFSQDKSANEVARKVRALGYKVEVVLREKTKDQIWLSLKQGVSVQKINDLLEKLKKENILLKSQEKSCQAVASLKRLH
ncbi:MAG: hypothetical protein OXE99_12580 [Cellvibrionales bacterium]|nr:hypothetical protein [Cellvibrionales bacterium]